MVVVTRRRDDTSSSPGREPGAPLRPPGTPPSAAVAGPLPQRPDAKLARLKKEADREWRAQQKAVKRKRRRRRASWGAFARAAAGFTATALLLGALPFYALIRSAVYLHEVRGLSTWLALAGGVLLTAAIVTAYGVHLAGGLKGKVPVRAVALRFALPFVTFYAIYSLVYLSSTHFKGPVERAYWGSVHPLVRLAVSTVVIVDRQIVITDVARRPSDYVRMGLPVNHGSLHLPQGDGYVHAIDLRTTGRSWLRNALVVVYFRVMGFDTLRHVGTADHLHLSLPQR
jgi:hypothetical protein